MHLIADALREIDRRQSPRKSPNAAPASYNEQLRLKEFTFETLEDYDRWRTQGRQAVR